MARMIAPVTAKNACALALMWAFLLARSAGAHDLEKTQVRLTFARDGAFVLDVMNDPSWLKLRLESIPGPFSDRVVLFVDGREIRPTSVERLAAYRGDGLDTFRMRGRMPLDAHTLRWYYGLVIDPYPLTVTRADGRIVVEEVQGNAWSGTIDLSRQFDAPRVSARAIGATVTGLLLLPAGLRFLFTTKDTKDTKETP
jgi:hypothetical protein